MEHPPAEGEVERDDDNRGDERPQRLAAQIEQGQPRDDGEQREAVEADPDRRRRDRQRRTPASLGGVGEAPGDDRQREGHLHAREARQEKGRVRLDDDRGHQTEERSPEHDPSEPRHPGGQQALGAAAEEFGREHGRDAAGAEAGDEKRPERRGRDVEAVPAVERQPRARREVLCGLHRDVRVVADGARDDETTDDDHENGRAEAGGLPSPPLVHAGERAGTRVEMEQATRCALVQASWRVLRCGSPSLRVRR